MYLGASEILNYITPPVVKQMAVDGTQNELMTVRMDITFPRVPCSVLSVDAYDQSGKNDQDVRGELHKERLNKDGKSLGSYDKAGGGVTDEEDALIQDLQQFFGGGMKVVFQKRAEHSLEVKHAVEKKEYVKSTKDARKESVEFPHFRARRRIRDAPTRVWCGE